MTSQPRIFFINDLLIPPLFIKNGFSKHLSKILFFEYPVCYITECIHVTEVICCGKCVHIMKLYNLNPIFPSTPTL
jgi:hypothetical protein